MKLDEEFQIIKCPCCGWQYMPAELYVPDAFIGTPSKISRDYLGHILYFDGETMCTDETYTCDNCGMKFVGDIKFDIHTGAFRCSNCSDGFIVSKQDFVSLKIIQNSDFDKIKTIKVSS